MKIVLCQPAIQRFKWELEVCVTRLQNLGYTDIVLLFAEVDVTIPKYFEDKFAAQVYTYTDDRECMQYQPSIKPWLWYKYLSENPEAEVGTYLYIDADVILREKLDMDNLPATPDTWYATDCGGYLDSKYVRQCERGNEIFMAMASIVGVSYDRLETMDGNVGGAQWVIVNPTAAYWHKVYLDTISIYKYFQTVDSNIQKWTAEMWAQLYNMYWFNIECRVSKELDMAWATDPLEKWSQVKVYHNAGVTPDMIDMFYKGAYDGGRSPFGETLSHVNPAKCSIKYVEAIKEVKMTTNG